MNKFATIQQLRDRLRVGISAFCLGMWLFKEPTLSVVGVCSFWSICLICCLFNKEQP